MEDLVQFKVFTYWTPEGAPEVRRFGIEKSVVTSFHYLNAKLQDVFPGLRGKTYTVLWKDEDGDEVAISSDEEMLIALSSLQGNIYKLFVKPKVQDDKDVDIMIAAFPEVSCGTSSQHVGVTCDGCEAPVSGFRYKCTVCSDYDLCSRCEAAGTHPEHCMVRVPTPTMPRALLRAAIKRSRHILKSVATTADEELAKRHRRDRSADKKRERDHHQHVRDHHRRTRTSWLETFATYMNEFANLAGDFDHEDPNANKDEKAQPAAPPNTAAAEAQPNTSKCPFRSSAPTGPLNSDMPTACPFRPPQPPNLLPLNTESLRNLMKTYIDSMPARHVGEMGQGDRKDTEADGASVKEARKSSEHDVASFKSADAGSDKASVNSDVSSTSNEVKREPSLDKADDWMMVNQDKDLMDAFVLPSAPEAQNPIGFNLPEEFRQRVNISGGNLYPPLNLATAVMNYKEVEQSSAQAAPAPVQKAPAPAPTPAAPAPSAAASAPSAAAAAPKPAQPKPKPQPRHPSPHIEAAIQQMLSMGFTNDGGWLTQLLESKDGNIAAVLDLLTPVNPKQK